MVLDSTFPHHMSNHIPSSLGHLSSSTDAPTAKWSAGDAKLRDDIAGLMNRPPVRLPTADQFTVPLRFAPLLKIPHRPHTVELFEAYRGIPHRLHAHGGTKRGESAFVDSLSPSRVAALPTPTRSTRHTQQSNSPTTSTGSPASPRSERENAGSPSLSNRAGSGNLPPVPSVPSPARGAQTRPSNRAGELGSRDDSLPELTLTYLGILRHSEDFNRRAITKDEQKRRALYRRWMDAFQAMIPVLLGEVREQQLAESSERESIEQEHADVVEKLTVMAESSLALARRREGSRPACAILKPHRSSLISEAASERCFVELRWRGGVDLCFAVIVVDLNDALVGIASNGEGVRGKGRVLLLRPLNDYDGNCGSGVGGSRCTFQVNLHSCPSNVSRMVFVACPRGNSESLAALKQGWLTLSDTEAATGAARPMLTISVLPFAFHGAVVAGSLRRRNDCWQFCNDYGTLLGHRRPVVVAQLLLMKTSGEWEHLDRELQFCRASIGLQECLERAVGVTVAQLHEMEALERAGIAHLWATTKRPKRFHAPPPRTLLATSM